MPVKSSVFSTRVRSVAAVSSRRLRTIPYSRRGRRYAERNPVAAMPTPLFPTDNARDRVTRNAPTPANTRHAPAQVAICGLGPSALYPVSAIERFHNQLDEIRMSFQRAVPATSETRGKNS